MTLADLIAALGWTQQGAARFLKLTDRTLRRWIADDDPPIAVWMVLRLLYSEQFTPAELLDIAGVGKREAKKILSSLSDGRFNDDDD